VVVSLITSNQEFQLMQAADARAAAERVGVAVEVVFAEHNAVQQIMQLYKFVHAPEEQRPAAIVVEAVRDEGMERLARNAVKAGIGWVSQQGRTGYLASLRAESGKVPVASVSVDEEEIGRIQARQFHALRPKGGGVLVLQGPIDSPTAVARFRGLKEAISGSSITLKRVLNADWTERGAEAAVTSWLQLKTTEAVGIDLVGSQNDSMASGAQKAIRELRKDWARIPCTGCDGLPEGGRRMVDARQLAATIVKPTTAGPAVELVARAIQGQPVPLELVLQSRSYPPLEQLVRRGASKPVDSN
jgi:ABC-type sugar transport system substrate-binding protein